MINHQPQVPLSAASLPQQRIYEVTTTPDWQSGVEPFVGYTDCLPVEGLPKRRSKNAVYLCQVEWAWSPAHNRLDAYYLARGRRHWLLWLGMLEDEDTPWRWQWSIVAGVERRGVGEQVAAAGLLQAFWDFDRNAGGLGRYHWINETGLLAVADVAAISAAVWGR